MGKSVDKPLPHEYNNYCRRKSGGKTEYADVAELADALDSGSNASNGMEVQVLSSAPENRNTFDAKA